MGKYIDKDALVAEIERNLKYANNGILYAQNGFEKGLNEYEVDLNAWEHCQSMCKNILSILDTLEVKEVDLEKELDLMITPELKFHKALPSLMDVAKHFFELGIKVQKGE